MHLKLIRNWTETITGFQFFKVQLSQYNIQFIRWWESKDKMKFTVLLKGAHVFITYKSGDVMNQK